MNVSLTETLDNWVNEQVESGLYTSSSEVIREGLRLLIEKKSQSDLKLELLRSDLRKGIEQLDSGRARVFDRTVLNEISQTGRDHLSVE
jgi:antitoxin ParD1/3/4